MAGKRREGVERVTLLDAVKLAYRKHCMGDDLVSWGEVDQALLDALCNELGDIGFRKWKEELSDERPGSSR